MRPLTVTEEDFDQEVMKSDKPVLVDFWAVWCGPCRMVGPIIEQIAEETSGRVKVCKINVDEQGGLAQMFDVSSIPTLLVIKDGKVTQRAVGVRSKQDILDMLK